MIKKLPSGVEFNQWRIETHKSTILTTEEMDEYELLHIQVSNSYSHITFF